MDCFEKLSHKICRNLEQSGIVKAEDSELYIYGINQILFAILNLSSALIIGVICGVFFEVAVFMVAYIPLRSFAGGVHAKTPLRCYIISVIMLIGISLCMKYVSVACHVYYVILAATSLVVFILSPVEDKNKPLDMIEQSVYKKRANVISLVELLLSILLKTLGLDSLFVAIVYSYTVLSIMLIAGKIKNHLFY